MNNYDVFGLVVVSVDNNNHHVNNIYSNILLVCALFAIKKVEPTI